MNTHATPVKVRGTLLAGLAATLLSVVLVLALASSARAADRSQRATCHSLFVHSGHGARACAGSRGAGGRSAGHGARRHSRKTRKHGKHHAKKKHARKPDGSAVETGHEGERQTAAKRTLEATCEDTSSPVIDGEGAFSCQDGSEPRCEEGLLPILSESGVALVCEAEPGEESDQETEYESDD